MTLVGVTGLLVPAVAFADTPPAMAGTTVSPVLKNVVAQAGQNDIQFIETIENDTQQLLTVTPLAADFGTSGVNGAVQLKQHDAQHGLAQVVQFSPATFALAKGQSQQVAVTLHGVADLSPGGHFAAIRWRLSSPPSARQQSVGIHPELMSFVFLATAGRATYGVALKASLPHVVLWQLPTETDLLFTNTANTQTAPRGVVNIAGPHHSQVANSIINTGSALVLPGSTRLFQTPLARMGVAWWPGRYSVDMYYRASENSDYQHMQEHFWYIGWPCWLVGAGLVASLAVLTSVCGKRLRRRRTPRVNPVQPVSATIAEKRLKIPIKHL